MSTKKYTNVEVCEIHLRLMKALRLHSKSALAKALGTSVQNLKNREDRGVNKLDDVELLCNREKIDREWVFTGKEAAAFIQSATGNGFLQGHHIDAEEIHIHNHQVQEPEDTKYVDPVQEMFIQDWLKLSDVDRLRAWTVIREMLARKQEQSKED